MFQTGGIVVLLINVAHLFADDNLIREKISTKDRFCPNYLLNHVQFRLLLHFDNTTKDCTNLFLPKLSTSLKIINHDAATNQLALTKHRGVKYLNLVVLSNPLTFSNQCRSIQTTDFVVFFTNPTNFVLISE